MSLWDAIIIAIVEALTEFLPVSSTGHMIIANHLLGVEQSPFTNAFIITTQFSAILSVVVLYWKRFFQSFDFYFKLFVAFIPAMILGLLLDDFIEGLLNNVTIVAIMLLLGGFILIVIDKFLNPPTETEVTYPKAFKIGLFQCIAMIPGVSRSAASIIGGMTQGLTRKQAAEFSFFLAVPTMFGAATLKLYQLLSNHPEAITNDGISILIIGNLVSFLGAILAIKGFIHLLTRHGFKVFGYYRIVVGALLLILIWNGVQLQLVD